MGEECDHVHIIALSDALGVAIRVVYLDRSSCDNGPVAVNHHDFIPAASADGSSSLSSGAPPGNPAEPFVTLLYRPGHYDILYRR
ncbi:Ubiquitin thioesterase otubain-like [Platanthera guangdongensis]|uniref:Ubiquitin thioesterase otubain-like n=1 Tax=Platanthera guangdongensis TaxID=2320717 RepID=A0ABR2MNG9_9ASPA